MSIPRSVCEQAFRAAVQACDLERVVRYQLTPVVAAAAPGVYLDQRRPSLELSNECDRARGLFAFAAGKGALAMARGLGAVKRGIAVTPADDDKPIAPGWQVMVAAHPHPDERSLAAGAAVRELVEDATDLDVVFALVSGGASALIEQPRIPLDELRETVRAAMHAGAPIAELNVVRAALSELKGGGLARGCAARIVTLVASDVVGDPLAVVGSGPTIGTWLDAPGKPVDFGAVREARRTEAIEILERRGVAVPDVLHTPLAADVIARNDRAELIAPLAAFAHAVVDALAAPATLDRVIAGRPAPRLRVLEPALTGDVESVAGTLVTPSRMTIAYGEPTLAVPADHGEGGRAQQLALVLARELRGTQRSAFVAGSDGIDGPPPRDRPAPAGAYVDGSTWDAIITAGIDPAAALARCDAGTALHAAGALFVCGPTGINHADVMLLG